MAASAESEARMHFRTELASNSSQLPSDEAKNLVDLLRRRATQQPTRQAYTFLVDGQEKHDWLTFSQLDLQARAIAVLLESLSALDERVLLLYPPGLEYISSFMGCLYARAVAVPVPPPRFNRKMERILMVAADSNSRLVLTTRAILSKVDSLLEKAPQLRSLSWVATDDLDLRQADDWRAPEVDGDTLAFLQYTSGSTATPRGVMVTHHNLLHNERLIQTAFEQTGESMILSWLPFYHDMGLIGGVLQPLYLGAKCMLMSPYAFLQRPLGWLRAISDYKITTSGGPDFAYDLCIRKATRENCSTLDLSSWTVAFNGSEPIKPETIKRFCETFEPFGFKSSAFYPCYGLAEATLLVSGGRGRSQPLVSTVSDEALKGNRILEAQTGGSDSHSLVTGGQIAVDQTVIIVDPESLTRCPADHVGEVWVSGPSVARGYYNRAEETRQTFQAYLAGTGHGPFLRTGDLGFIKDGELFITGRIKDLIIIRGQNYYPQDIEATLQKSSTALRKGCGAAFSVEVDGRQRLAIVQEVAGRRPQNPDALIELIRQAVAEEHQLPPYSICLIREGSIPRTSSGKIRRRQCQSDLLEGKLNIIAAWQEPAVCESQDSNFSPDTLPTDVVAMEGWLASLLAAKLGVAVSAIDVSRSIPGYGLDSLAVIELMHAIEARLAVSIQMPKFFQAGSLRELARLLFEMMDGSSSSTPTPISPKKEVAEFNLSRGQEALYFLHQLVTDAAAYNIAALGIIRNSFDKAALRKAFQLLVDRHPSLRTNVIATADGTKQRVAQRQELCFTEEQAVSWTEDELNRRIREEANRRFDLEEDRLLRITLYERAEGFRLLMVAHHIVTDFWSLGIFIRELSLLYAAQLSGTDALLPPVTSQFSDYVQWQEEMLSGAEGERLWSYWDDRLRGELPMLSLPTDRPRPPIQTYAGDSIRFNISQETADGLNLLSRQSETTLFTTLAAAFETLLHRYTGQDDLLLGVLTNGRGRLGFKEVAGYFVNPVVISASFSDDPTFSSLLNGTRTAVLEAFEHQDFPFALLIEKLQQMRGAARTPLIQAMFIYHKAHLPGQEELARFATGDSGAILNIGGVELESVPLNQGVTQFDLTLRAAVANDGEIRGLIEYNTDLFDAATIARMSCHLRMLLEGIIATPNMPISELPMMPKTELEQVLFDWNLTAGSYPEGKCLHHQCREQVRRTPDAVAVSFGEEQVTYAELDARANQLAHHLIKRGIRPETRVGICVGRSVEMIVGLLAILKSGGAYVPLDPYFPPQRLSLMIADSELSAIVTTGRMIEALPTNDVQVVYLDADRDLIARESNADPGAVVFPENTAYVIYTSGSTGKPKGVQVEHRNAINFLHAMDRLFGEEPPGHWLAVTSISFDISVLELFWTLARGFHVVVQEEQKRVQRETIEEAGHRQEEANCSIPARLTRHAITHLQCTPSTARQMSYDPEFFDAIRGLKKLLIGGEASTPALIQELGTVVAGDIYNMYGPTETAIWSTSDLVEKSAERVTIGRPLLNTEVYLLDRKLGPVPVGITGGLYIGGQGVVRGYLNAPDLTAERFLPDKFGLRIGSRLYATGDLARYLPDGKVEFLGRADQQVKLRGHRIELGEIEAALDTHPAVLQSAVVLQEDVRGEKRLIAYAVLEPGGSLTISLMREFLKDRLPDYLIPSGLMQLDVMPLTPNGKIHRKGLPAVGQVNAGERISEPPRNRVEEALSWMWAETLGVEEVGIHDDFFEIGGHSILASRLVSHMRETFQIELSMRTFFDAPTVAKLAETIIRDEQQAMKVERIAELLMEVINYSDEEVEAKLGESHFTN